MVTLRRLAACLLGTIALAGTAVLGNAPSALARQGGCSNYSGSTGTSPGSYNIGICVNDHNTGTNAYPDYYVNSPLPSNCRIVVEVWDNGGGHRFGPVFQDGNSCASGHHPASGSWCVTNWDPAGYGSNLTVHAYFRIYINGQQKNNTYTNSPPIGVTYTGMAHC
jgi:hypothetical protein